jgi:hypothetical protein
MHIEKKEKQRAGRRIDHSTYKTTVLTKGINTKFRKDFIQSGDLSQVNLGPEILSDPVIQQMFARWGYAIIQIGDRLVRVYGQPTDPKWQTSTPVPEKPAPQYDAVKLPDPSATRDDTPGINPSPYSQMPYGQDPRYEMSSQDNMERERNALWQGRQRQKAIARYLLLKNQPLSPETKKDIAKIMKNVKQTLIEGTK